VKCCRTCVVIGFIYVRPEHKNRTEAIVLEDFRL
jgi:hypothetical protein